MKVEIYRKNKLLYNLFLDRKVIILKGDSGIGKTNLYNLVELIKVKDIDRLIKIESELPLISVNEDNYMNIFENTKAVYFIDEDFSFNGKDKLLKKLNNNFEGRLIIITRTKLKCIPHSYKAFYTLKYKNGSVQNELINEYFEDLYININTNSYYGKMVTEDSKTGYEMFSYFSLVDIDTIKGKYNLRNYLEKIKYENYKYKIIIVDGASFGDCFYEIAKYIMDNNVQCILYMPESFEYLLLKSYFNYKIDNEIGSEYVSWERFFNKKLRDMMTQNNIGLYSKKKLNDFFVYNKNEFIKNLPNELINYITDNIEKFI